MMFRAAWDHMETQPPLVLRAARESRVDRDNISKRQARCVEANDWPVYITKSIVHCAPRAPGPSNMAQSIKYSPTGPGLVSSALAVLVVQRAGWRWKWRGDPPGDASMNQAGPGVPLGTVAVARGTLSASRPGRPSGRRPRRPSPALRSCPLPCFPCAELLLLGPGQARIRSGGSPSEGAPDAGASPRRHTPPHGDQNPERHAAQSSGAVIFLCAEPWRAKQARGLAARCVGNGAGRGEAGQGGDDDGSPHDGVAAGAPVGGLAAQRRGGRRRGQGQGRWLPGGGINGRASIDGGLPS